MVDVHRAILLLLLATPSIVNSQACNHRAFLYVSSFYSPVTCDISQGHYPLYADFNGDGRTDHFCKRDGSVPDEFSLAEISGAFETLRDPRTQGWCQSNEGIMLAAEMNGDGMADLVCRYTDGSKFGVRYSSSGKFMSESLFHTHMDCPFTIKLHVGDVSGDGVDDFVCHNLASGIVRIHYNGQKRYAYYSPYDTATDDGYYQMEIPFCQGSTKTFHIGDFNADRKQDLACYEEDGATGKMHIAFAQSHGHYDKIESIVFPTYHGLVPPFDQLIMDINGDGASDFIPIGYITNSNLSEYEVVNLFDRFSKRFVSLAQQSVVACDPSTVFAGDFNGDGLYDIACFGNSNTFELVIRFSACTPFP